MQQWYKCPECSNDILFATNPCPYCKCSLEWSQQMPNLRLLNTDIELPQVVGSSVTVPISKKSISRWVDFYISLGLTAALLIFVLIISAANGMFMPLSWGVVLALVLFTTCYAIFALARVDLRSIQWNRPIQLPKRSIKLSKKQKVVLVSALSILVVFMVCINSNESSNSPPPDAEPAPIPTPIRHDITWSQITGNSAYWNQSWQGKQSNLIEIARRTNLQYLDTHTYIKNQTDCNDMAIDIWNMLWTQGIRSIIVAGNVDNPAPLYTLNQCNHAFLIIPLVEPGKTTPSQIVLEPTNGEVYLGDAFERNPQLNLYLRGFYYIQPSDLRADLGKNW